MPSKLLVLIALLACGVAAATPAADADAAQSESLLTMRVDGEIAIDASGKPIDYRIASELQPELRQLIAKAVPAWSFWPVLIDGKAVAARTKMRITLAAQPAANGYSVRIDNVTFRDESAAAQKSPLPGGDVEIAAKSLRPPSYPVGLQRYGAEGMVMLHLKLTPQGKVEQAFAVQSSLFNIRGKPDLMDKARALLEKNSIAAARRWSFSVDTKGIAVTAEDLTVAVPVSYVLNRSDREKTAQWRHEVRGPMQGTPWLNATRMAQRIGSSDVDAGEVLDITSPLRLRHGVIGKAL